MSTFRRRATVLLALSVALLVAACVGEHGHWEDPDARLVDGTWIGSQDGCPPARDECAVIVAAARAALSSAEQSRVDHVAWVALPTQFVTDGGEPRSPRLGAGILTWVAALVTFVDQSERVIGLSCHLPFDGDGHLQTAQATCSPKPLTDWLDGAVPPSFPHGTTFG